jgi:GntR family transcriptional regulator
VSRVTLRRAVELLVDEGLLVRRQGSGTFVKGPRITHAVVGLHSTRDVARAHGLSLEAEIVDFHWGVATELESQKLDLGGTRDNRVLRFLRCDRLEGEVLGTAECTLPASVASGISRDDCQQHSTYELLEGDNLRISRAVQVFRAEAADNRRAALFGCRIGHPVFVLDRTTYAGDIPVEWAIVSYRHTVAECRVELARTAGGGREAPTGISLNYFASDGK